MYKLIIKYVFLNDSKESVINCENIDKAREWEKFYKGLQETQQYGIKSIAIEK